MEDVRAERDQQQGRSKGEVSEDLKQMLSAEHALLGMSEVLTSSKVIQTLQS
jgi:hypothetical protein